MLLLVRLGWSHDDIVKPVKKIDLDVGCDAKIYSMAGSVLEDRTRGATLLGVGVGLAGRLE